MIKKIIAVLLIFVIAACSLSACSGKNEDTQKKGSGSSVSDKGDESASDEDAKTADAGKETTAAADAKDAGKQQTTAASGKDAAATAKADDKTDGWKKSDGGKYQKGAVSVDVVKYGSAKLDDGKELISQLVEAGLADSTLLSSEKTKTSITYCYSGKRIGVKDTEYIMFRYVVEKKCGYLVTLIASQQEDLETDISYLLSHLSELAK